MYCAALVGRKIASLAATPQRHRSVSGARKSVPGANARASTGKDTETGRTQQHVFFGPRLRHKTTPEDRAKVCVSDKEAYKCKNGSCTQVLRVTRLMRRRTSEIRERRTGVFLLVCACLCVPFWFSVRFFACVGSASSDYW